MAHYRTQPHDCLPMVASTHAHDLNRREAAIAVGAMCIGGAARGAMPWPTLSWSVAAPETQGMNPKALEALAELGRASSMDSLLVARRGHIVLEAYYEPFRREMLHPINSATKGIVAALLAIARAKGLLLPPEAALLDYFPGRDVANLGTFKQAITLQHVLDMQSGLAWDEPLDTRPPTSLRQLRASADWVQFVLDRPMALPPGQAFNYNSGASHLLSAVLTRVTGLPADEYARRELFGPLGIADFQWQKDPQGIAAGGFGLSLTTRDMAKIALLVQQEGQWDGRQVLPREWVAGLRSGRVPMVISANLDFRYGQQWWRLPEYGALMAVGFNRQVVLVMHDLELVAASTGRSHWDFRRALEGLRAAVVG